MPKINTYPALNTIREADLVVIATPAGSARSDAPAGVFIVSFAKFKQLIGSGLTPGERDTLEGAAQVDAIDISDRDLNFYSDGGQTKLINIPGISAQNEGSLIGNANGITELNFKGAGVSASASGPRADITVPGGSANLLVVSSFPSSPDASKIYYLSQADGSNSPGFYRYESGAWARVAAAGGGGGGALLFVSQLPSSPDGSKIYFLSQADGSQVPGFYRWLNGAWEHVITNRSLTSLGEAQTAVFQVPVLSSTRLTAVTANVPVFHNIASFTGAGIAGVLTQSAVSNIARVTLGQSGFVNVHFADEVQITSSTAGSSGRDGELVLVLTQYASGGDSKRTWMWEHGITDPITTGINVPIDITTGLTPVEVGDYFTLNFAFNAAQANTYISIQLPADNPGMDERLEFVFFPTESLTDTTNHYLEVTFNNSLGPNLGAGRDYSGIRYLSYSDGTSRDSGFGSEMVGSKSAAVSPLAGFLLNDGAAGSNNGYSYIYAARRSSSSVKPATETWLENQRFVILNGTRYGLGAIKAGTTSRGARKFVVPLANAGTDTGAQGVLRSFVQGVSASGATKLLINFQDALGAFSYGNKGATSWRGLSDTPASFSGQGGKHVAVNAGATALEFVDAGGGGSSDELSVRASLPAAGDFAVGDMVNVSGNIYVLQAGSGDRNIHRGVIEDRTGSYIGDDFFEWELNPPNIRAYLPQSAVGSSPPTNIAVEVHSGRVYSESLLTRRSQAAGVWTYTREASSPGIETAGINPGDSFSVAFYTDATKATPFNVKSSSNRWVLYNQEEITEDVAPEALVGNTDRWAPPKLGTGSPSSSDILYGDGVWRAAALETAQSVRDKLETLQGNDRLEASAIQNLPEPQRLPSRTTIPSATPVLSDPEITIAADPGLGGAFLYSDGQAGIIAYFQAINIDAIGSKDDDVANLSAIRLSPLAASFGNASRSIVAVAKRTSASVKPAAETWLENQKTILIGGTEFGLSQITAGTVTGGASKFIVPLANKGTSAGAQGVLASLTFRAGQKVGINFKDDSGNLAYDQEQTYTPPPAFILTQDIAAVAPVSAQNFPTAKNTAGGVYAFVENANTSGGTIYFEDGSSHTPPLSFRIDSSLSTDGVVFMMYHMSSQGFYFSGISSDYANRREFRSNLLNEIEIYTRNSAGEVRKNTLGNRINKGGFRVPSTSNSFYARNTDIAIVNKSLWMPRSAIPGSPEYKAGEYHLINGMYFRLQTDDEKTPRRVTELPAERGSREGETVYVDADYSHANGVNVSAQEFAGTELDSATNSDAQAGIGDRGWYAKADAGFQFGQIYPALPDDFVLISNARVYVKRNTQTNLSKIYLGETSYALTRVPQPAGTKIINNPAFAASEPDVDYYTITGGLPAGDWDNLRFETTTMGRFIPASSIVEKGLYQFENSDWVQAGFFAPLAQPDKDFTISVEEERPGVKANKAVTVAASGSTFTAADPFPGIARLTYNNDSNETELYQRFSVNVSLTGFEDSKAPAVLQLGSVNYSLSYFETDAGIAVYRTPKIKASEQVSAAGAIASVNIQLKNGSWAGQSGATKVLRTINKGELQAAANAALPVHQAPTSPVIGQRIEPLADLTVQGGAILTAAESSGTSSAGVNITGLFTGYEDDSAYDNGSAGGDLGSLDPEDTTKILGLLSFSNARAAGNEANKTMVVVAVGFDPAKAYINRRAYTLGALVNNHFKALTGLDGSYLKAGQKYLINIEKSDGTKAFPDVTLKQGEIYFWDGLQWIQEKRGLELSEVNARIDAKVPRQFRADADTTGQLFQPSDFWLGTQTQYDAATKTANRVFFVE